MKIFNTLNLKQWSETVESKFLLPLLVRKLILSTIPLNRIKKIHFLYGENVFEGGYDGVLSTKQGNLFVPDGLSVWELGVSNNKKQKADSDYEKRKKNTLGINPNQTTYINVSLKAYKDKNKWEEEKRKEEFWENVKFYDVNDIDQWLDDTKPEEKGASARRNFEEGKSLRMNRTLVVSKAIIRPHTERKKNNQNALNSSIYLQVFIHENREAKPVDVVHMLYRGNKKRLYISVKS